MDAADRLWLVDGDGVSGEVDEMRGEQVVRTAIDAIEVQDGEVVGIPAGQQMDAAPAEGGNTPGSFEIFMSMLGNGGRPGPQARPAS